MLSQPKENRHFRENWDFQNRHHHVAQRQERCVSGAAVCLWEGPVQTTCKEGEQATSKEGDLHAL